MNATEIQMVDDLVAVEEGMLQDIEIAEHKLYDVVIANKPHIRWSNDGALYSDLGDRFARVSNNDKLRAALEIVESAFKKQELTSPVVGAWD